MRTSTSMGQLQTANSVQKYVYRMNKVRENNEMKQVEADKKTGSGKNWTNRITVPKEPSLSYKRGRSKRNRKNASIERNLSKELLARNISLENIKTQAYHKEDEPVQSLHTHYYFDNDSETLLQSTTSIDRMRQNRNLLAEKILENNESRTSIISSQKSLDQTNCSNLNDFSKSSSNIDNLRARALLQLSPKNQPAKQCKSPEPGRVSSKPPLAPAPNNVTNRVRQPSNPGSIRIFEQEVIEETESQPGDNSHLELHESAISAAAGKYPFILYILTLPV